MISLQTIKQDSLYLKNNIYILSGRIHTFSCQNNLLEKSLFHTFSYKMHAVNNLIFFYKKLYLYWNINHTLLSR